MPCPPMTDVELTHKKTFWSLITGGTTFHRYWELASVFEEKVQYWVGTSTYRSDDYRWRWRKALSRRTWYRILFFRNILRNKYLCKQRWFAQSLRSNVWVRTFTELILYDHLNVIVWMRQVFNYVNWADAAAFLVTDA